ncbi:MAG: ROK family protein [Phycisphaerae bacterium]
MSDLTALAIDLGGSHAACAVVRGDTIIARRDVLADGASDLGDLLPALRETLFDLLKAAGIMCTECSAVVLGFCGIVSTREKRVLATNKKFDDAPRLDLDAYFKGAFGLPFLLENDARLALLGEHRFGAARGTPDAVMVTLGSGIGGAALLNGRLLQSRHGLAGTIGGHLPVVLNGRLCSCGNLGCAEAEASTVFLPAIYRQQPNSKAGVLHAKRAIGFAELFEASDAGDAAAVAALEHCLDVWSALTVALIHAYDPEVVVFGGSVLKRDHEILPRLQKFVNAHAWTCGRHVPLKTATLGSSAALLGAIPLLECSL